MTVYIQSLSEHMNHMQIAEASAENVWNLREWTIKNPMPLYKPTWNMLHVDDFYTCVYANEMMMKLRDAGQQNLLQNIHCHC